MNRTQERMLVAGLCGLLAVAAAGAVRPAIASGYAVARTVQITGAQPDDLVHVRQSPGSKSEAVAAFAPGSQVWVERCVERPGSDWCFIDAQETKGWVNARFLSLAPDGDA